MLFWSTWIPLNPATVEEQLSDVSGLYEVKVAERLVDYPAGRSAMIYYGMTTTRTQEAQSLRQLVLRDWFTPGKEPIRKQWEAYAPLVFRWAMAPDPRPEHARRTKQFVERFGRMPWGNQEEPEAGSTTQDS